MVDIALSVFSGLALCQALFYRIELRETMSKFRFLWVLYFSLFVLASGVHILCAHFSILFYQVPLLVVILFGAMREGVTWFPRFRRRWRGAPEFYLFSSLWVSICWLSLFAESDFLNGLVWSLVASLLLLFVVGIKARLELADPPIWFSGPPIFCIAVGLFLLGLWVFRGVGNW